VTSGTVPGSCPPTARLHQNPRFDVGTATSSDRLRAELEVGNAELAVLDAKTSLRTAALGLGQGAELMQPLAVAVVGGLTVSMLLTLFVVPSAYLIFNAAAERLGAWITGRRGGEVKAARGSSLPGPARAGTGEYKAGR
jgi:hypothetical protein